MKAKKANHKHANSSLPGVDQEILICSGPFDKGEFRLFFVLYSNGTVWPKIWRQEKA